MIHILPYISVFIMIFGGGYLALLGFRIINPKKDNPVHQEKMIKWHAKFGSFAKYVGTALVIWGIINLVYPDLNAFSFKIKTDNAPWTQEQKSEMKRQVLNSSKYLQSINPDTADLVLTCYVDKYTEKFTVKEFREQDKLTQDQLMKKIMPIIKECFKQYGLKTIN
jgi:hypothetical protein